MWINQNDQIVPDVQAEGDGGKNKSPEMAVRRYLVTMCVRRLEVQYNSWNVKIGSSLVLKAQVDL